MSKLTNFQMSGVSQMGTRLKWSLLCLLWLAFVGIGQAQTAQNIAITAVTNSADFQPGFPQRGSLASIFTTGLQGAPGIYNAAPEYPLSNVLNGISVWINFLRAPILSIAFLIGYQQINVQVPWEGERAPLYVEVFQNGARGHLEAGQQYPWERWSIGGHFSVFFANANGNAIAQHVSDYSLVTPENPAHAGEYIVAYGINLGPVSPWQANWRTCSGTTTREALSSGHYVGGSLWNGSSSDCRLGNLVCIIRRTYTRNCRCIPDQLSGAEGRRSW